MNQPQLAHGRARLVEFDYLRGLAIVLIVIGHSVFLSGKGFPILFENLIRGATGIFVFISGFFFHRVFYPHFVWRFFMLKKLRGVFVPFLFISLISLVFRVIGWKLQWQSWDEIWAGVWGYVSRGYVLYPHWYIPFIMLTFALSPLHKAYIDTSLRWQLFWLIGSTLAALLIQRPAANIDPLQSFVYFTPFYLLGIIYSRYTDWLFARERLLFWLAMAAVVIGLLVQTYVYPHIGNYQKAPFEWKGIDWQFIQKMGLCVCLISGCRKLPDGRLGRHLRLMADISFPLFFVHPLLSMAVGDVIYCAVQFGWEIPRGLWPAIWISTLILLFQLYGSTALILTLRRRLGEKSKWIIG